MNKWAETYLDSRVERAVYTWLRRIVSLEEIEKSTALLWVWGATLFSYFVTFSGWLGSSSTTVEAAKTGSYSCWPYFQSCHEYAFLHMLPNGYSQTTLYMFFMFLMFLTVYFLHKKEYFFAYLATFILFLWNVSNIFILSDTNTGNYDYYLAAFGIILFLFPHKEFFLKLSIPLFYFLSTTIKIHEGWTLGTYFTAMTTGLPFVGDAWVPLMTNQLIFMEMIGAWFLLSHNKWLQRSVFFYFAFFHLYSGVLVEYRYPSTVMPTLVILFGMFYRYQSIPVDKKSIVGWVFVALLCALQSVSLWIPGDTKLTLEGNKFGLHMFEANHQCVSRGTIYLTNGETKIVTKESGLARGRCDPYRYMKSMQISCTKEKGVDHISWTFDHSINGGAFYRIVDVPNVCALQYMPFQRNDWIKTEYDNPLKVGYPKENWYY